MILQGTLFDREVTMYTIYLDYKTTDRQIDFPHRYTFQVIRIAKNQYGNNFLLKVNGERHAYKYIYIWGCNTSYICKHIYTRIHTASFKYTHQDNNDNQISCDIIDK